MPTFGTHDTDSRILLTGGGGVYVLKLDHSRAIKIFQPADYFFTDSQLRPEVDAFLLRAKTQRLLAKSSKNWAPVHEISALKEHDLDNPPYPGAYRAAGAYAISNRYERSLQSLIDGFVHVTNDDLRNIFTQVISALIDAKKSPLKRAHGALKPSNILLTNSATLAAATVHLADPAPDGALSSDPFSRDLNDLGKILAELILLRPYTKEPLGASREWKALGPNGEDWRNLTTALLDAGGKIVEHPSMAGRERRSHNPAGPSAPSTPAPTPAPSRPTGPVGDQPDLEKILADMSKWTLQPKKAPVIPIAIAASILLIGSVTGLYFLLRTPTADFDQPTWARLCLNYGTWFSSFSDTASTPDGRAKLAAADFPPQIIPLFDKAVHDGKLATYSPYHLSGKTFRLSVLAVQPTPEAKSGKNAYITRQALDFIDQVDATLTPDQWPTLKNLQATAATYRERQWFKPANAIISIMDEVKPPVFPKLPAENGDPPDLVATNPSEFDRVASVVSAYHSVADIENRWKRILAAEKTLPQTPVPLLNALPAFAETLPRTPDEPGRLSDITSLADAFGKVETLINQLSADLNKKDQTIVYDELAKDPAAQVPAGGPTLASYETLPALAQAYVKLPVDPRDAVPFQKTLTAMQTEDIAVITRSNPEDPNLAPLTQRYKNLTDAVAKMNALSPIQKNREQLVSLVTANHADLDKLDNDAANWSQPYKVDPPVYIAKRTDELTNSPLAKGSPALYANWKIHHSALLEKIKADPEKLKDYKYFDPVDKKFDALAKAYSDLQEVILPPAVTGLSAMPADPAWAKNIATHVAIDDREKALADLVANAKFADDLPQFADASYQSYQTQRLKTFDDLRVATLDLIADYTTIQTRLDHLDLLPNEPAQGDKSWRDLYAKWNAPGGGGAKSPLLADDLVVAALRPISDRVTALLKLDSLTDYAPLATDAQSSPAPELALAAWRKLGEIPITESNPVLDDETKSQSHLSEEFSTLSKSSLLTPAHAASLNAELTAARPIRWRRYADVLVTAKPIESALDAAPAFAVTLSSQTDPRMTFNAALNDLRKKFQADPRPDDPALKKLTQTFLDTVSNMPVVKDPSFPKVDSGDLDRIAKPLKSTAEQESKSSSAGPLLAGWDSKPREGIVVFSYPHGAAAPTHVLEFDRVQVQEDNDQKQIYLSSTEVSIGLFADIINANPTLLPAIDNASAAQKHWLTAGADAWNDLGPRGWQITLGALRPNDTWLWQAHPNMAGKSFYPPNAAPPAPSPNSPIQNISPYTAMFFARVLGCRLPTSTEWHAAVAVYESKNTQADAWNLRGSGPGASWQSQQTYTAQLANPGLAFPDTNVFAGHTAYTGVDAKDATPFTYDILSQALAKNPLPGNRLSASSGTYNANTLWFRDVGKEPGLPTSAGSGVMHDLIGNVAEYVFDAPNASSIIRDNKADAAVVEKTITDAPNKSLNIIGGSSLSPPQLSPFDAEPVLLSENQANTGYADVGFRLAYTAPLETISDALFAIFQSPHYLPGAKAPR